MSDHLDIKTWGLAFATGCHALAALVFVAGIIDGWWHGRRKEPQPYIDPPPPRHRWLP